ncbi:Vacuolar cation/proton exchanger 3 [Hibiscus syriacus]|uniref:Vacuolar cation/proton exchanger n=1 Tax=Hibiscus syriacus TaxID=106335 RepID=A0A6A2WYN4_HIBSY|nr:Vacuolar cation/proton exchanger 3 [Hibiscus syriacus]
MPSSLLRKKSDPLLLSNVRLQMLRQFLGNVQEVILGTKLDVLFPAIPLAIAADFYKFGRTYAACRAFGGLLNATCGNATELTIALFALYESKIHVLKYSLLGCILSNLLLVLGTSLLCGGLANLKKEQRYDRKQADVNSLLLLLGLLCHMLPLMFRYAAAPGVLVAESTLQLSRASNIVILVAYIGYIIFQLKTHRQIFDAHQEDDEEEEEEEKAVIGFWSRFSWLVGMTLIIALLSEYVVVTFEAASESWGISISFISINLIPIVGNAAEHAGEIIFAFKNKLDISLGVALGSATQISMFADGTSHYMKGIVLCLCYVAIAACFFVHKTPTPSAGTQIIIWNLSLAGYTPSGGGGWCFYPKSRTTLPIIHVPDA